MNRESVIEYQQIKNLYLNQFHCSPINNCIQDETSSIKVMEDYVNALRNTNLT